MKMNLIFCEKTLTVDMVEYLQEAIKEFLHECNRKMNTPADIYLFDINHIREKLGNEQKMIFHRLIAKLLFVSKQCRPDIQVAIAFLTTWVMNPNKDDWSKLKQSLCYINNVIDLKLTLSVEGFNVTKWRVDTLYVVHPTVKSHTGGTI